MFYTIKLAFKNIFSRKSSAVIILFISFAITMIIVVNSIFDGTDNGIKTIFMESFTGNFVIREKTKDNVSLFGNVSLIDESVLPIQEISFYNEICDYLNSLPEVKSFISQLSSFSLLEIENKKTKAAVFGIDIENYLQIMPSIEITDGRIFNKDEKGILVSESWIENFKKENKKDIKIGTEVQLIFSDGNTFRIRSLPITGIYKYPLKNDVLDKIILADPKTVRSLIGMDEIYSNEVNIAIEDTSLIDSIDFNVDDMDSLFSEDSDIFVDESFTIDFTDFIDDEVIKNQSDITNWHFIVVRLNDEASTNKLINKFNKWAQKNNFPIEAVNWRVAAGPTAQYIFVLRIILLVGIFIILFAGLIVITNTLVINILDRTKEIGTMRALGANKRNIAFLCMSETFILTFVSSILSCFASFILVFFMSKFPITLNNIFFEQLFGGNKLIPQLTFSSICFGFIVSIIIGLLAWIMPVLEALKIMPIKAMKGGN